MGMVVRTNTMALNSFRQLNLNNSAVAKNIEKLSSGYRINRAGDDASGLAISEKMKAQITGLEAATQNAQDAISLVQTAEGALSEVHDMLNRMVELAEKAGNGTMEVKTSATGDTYGRGNTGTDRQALQDEMDQLCIEIDRIAKSTNFNKIDLFDGTLTKLTLQIGDTADAFNQMAISMSDMRTSNLLNASTVANYGTFTATTIPKVTGSTNTVGFNISNQTEAGKVLDSVRAVINYVSSERAKLGAIQNRLEHTINNLNVTAENMTAAHSRVRDTDMASEMMEYTKMNVLVQSAQAMLAQANQQPQSVLQLLQ